MLQFMWWQRINTTGVAGTTTKAREDIAGKNRSTAKEGLDLRVGV